MYNHYKHTSGLILTCTCLWRRAIPHEFWSQHQMLSCYHTHTQKGKPSLSGLRAAQRSAECRELIPARQSESNLSSTPPSHLPLQSVLGKGASVRSWQTRFCSVVDHVQPLESHIPSLCQALHISVSQRVVGAGLRRAFILWIFIIMYEYNIEE